jgi:hypothetical protein
VVPSGRLLTSSPARTSADAGIRRMPSTSCAGSVPRAIRHVLAR